MPMKCFLLYRPTMFPKCSIRSNGFYWFHYFVFKDKSNGRFMHTSIRVSAETCRTSPPYLMDCYNLKLTTLSCDNVSYRPQQLLREGNVFTVVCHSFCPHGGDLHPGEICLGGLPRWWSASGIGWGQTPLLDTTGYGQWAGGTHPTGMHSCWIWLHCYPDAYKFMLILLLVEDEIQWLNWPCKINAMLFWSLTRICQNTCGAKRSCL